MQSMKMDSGPELASYVSWSEAVRRVRSWISSLSYDVCDDELGASLAVMLDHHTPKVSAGAPVSIEMQQGRQIARGSLHSFMALIPPEALGARAVARGMTMPTSGTIRPLQAVGHLLGVDLDHAEIDRHVARFAHVRGWLGDDEAGGAAAMWPEAALNAWTRAEQEKRWAEAFALTCERLVSLILSGGVRAYTRDAAGAMQALPDGAFASDVGLDVVLGRFMPSPELELFSAEWDRARAASVALGEIWIDVDDLKKHRARRRRGTSAAEQRAVGDLLRRLHQWLADGADLAAAPKKANWVRDVGIEIAGSRAAAVRAWATATSSHPAFKRLQGRGRRPQKQSTKND